MAQNKKRQYTPVVSQIVIKPPQRKTSDVGQWRTALQAADMGRMKMLYDLYEDLLIDGVLADAVDKRVSAVTNAELTFHDANGQEVDAMTELMDSPAFEELLTTIMQARFWGRSAGEFDFSAGFNFLQIPYKHIKLENHNILINEYDDSGIDYQADDHILVIGKPRQFGLFLKTAPLAIWKRGGFGDYAQWLEIFGMPQRVGKYSSYDPESRRLLEQAMEQSGSAPWIVIPKESEVETVNNTGTGSSSNAHNEFRQACNEEMLITILGQTMTTLDGSSKSQSETHKEVEEGKNKSDIRFVRRVLNHLVLPLLEKRGFPVRGGKFVFPSDTEPLTVADIVSLADLIEIPASYLHDKYSIPMPENGEAIARRQAASPQPPPKEGEEETPEDEEEDDDEENIENADRQTFFRRLYDFFVYAPQAGAFNGNPLTLTDDNLHERLIKRTANGQTGFDPELFDWISHDLIGALTGKPVQLADLGFAYNYQNDAFRTAQELNLFHFSAAKSLAEIQRLNELYRQSNSFEEFYKAANKELDVFNKTWQRTEYATATLIAESSQSYREMVRQKNIFKYWRYKTRGDNKVRDEHRKLNGIVLRADDPRWDKIWPPNGWKCRCYVAGAMAHEVTEEELRLSSEIVDEYLASPEWAKIQAQGFGVNRAMMPGVFTENQQYIAKFPDQASRWLKDVDYRTYGLKSPESYRQAASGNLQPYTGSLDDFASGMASENGKRFLTDYNDRRVLFDVEGWAAGHKNKLADRLPFLKPAAETMKAPDEVWINARQDVYRLTKETVEKSRKERKSKPVNKLSQYVFLKYYKDKTIAVIANINKAGDLYEVVTFFPVNEKASVMRKFRSGMLIKKPSL